MSATFVNCSPSSHRDAQKGASTQSGNILVIGHRGAAGLAPENTLAAFKAAFDLGVDAVEMDVQLTRDANLVVYHDYTLKPEITRTTDGEWLDEWTSPAIKDLSLAELSRYDVGRLDPYTFYSERYPDQIPVDGETIPTLQAVINLRRSRDSLAELWIEIKTSPLAPQVSSRPEDVAAAVVQVVRGNRLTHDVKILSFDWQALHEVRQLAPEMATVCLTNTSPRMDTIQKGTAGVSPWTAGLDIDRYGGSIPALVAAAGGRFWAPRFNQIAPEDIDAAHHLGLGVIVWTPDGEKELQRFIARGVDGIITNRPDRLIALLGRK
jgi:glycerophosphoryl diester phosphodiesterase